MRPLAAIALLCALATPGTAGSVPDDDGKTRALRVFLAEPTDANAGPVSRLGPEDIGRLLDAAMPFRHGPAPRRAGQIRLPDGAVYLYELPRSYDAARPWPLVVSLHGTPSGHCALVHRSCQRGDPPKRGYILVSPCYPGGLWRQDEGGDMLRQTLHDVVRRFHVDWTRIHLDGYSSGGVGAWIYGARWADLFAGVVVRCGVPRADPEDLPNLASSRMFVIHGAKDTRRAPLDRTLSALRALTELGVAHEYLQFGGGHGCYARANPKVLDYLDGVSRAVPTRFRVGGSFAGRPRIVHFVSLEGGDHTLEVERTDEAIVLRVSALPVVRRLDVFLSEAWVDLDRPVTFEINRLRVRALPRRSAAAFVEGWRRYPFYATGHVERVFQAALTLVEDGVILTEPRAF